MAGLSASGLGSGLDIKSLISQLMTVEQQPIVALNKKEAGYQAKISALGSLKSVLSALQTSAESLMPATGATAADKFTTTSASSSDSAVVTATATNSAEKGSYTLKDVVLAKAQQIRKAGLVTPDQAGTLKITVGTGTAVSVDISAKATMSDIRNAINASGAEVTASVINDGTNDVLVLTAKNSGASNTISIDGSTTGANPTAFDIFDNVSTNPDSPTNNWELQREASDASVTVDGIVISSKTNSIADSITGLTLNLVKESAAPVTLTVSKNNASVSTSLNAFIKAYNDAVSTMKSLGNYDAVNKQASTLTGDATLRSAQSQLRTALFAASGGSNANLQRLSDLGVSVQLDGSLKLDSTKLTAAITSDFSSVATLVSDVGSRFKATVSALVSDDGAVAARIDGIKTTIKAIGTRRDNLNLLLAKIEENYTRQFTALDVQVAKMQNLSSSLSAQLASLSSLRSS